VALYSYADVNHHLPRGTHPQPELAPEKRLSWLVDILPYLEEQAVYDEVNKSRAWDDAENRMAVSQMVPLLHCPTHWDPPVGPAIADQTDYVAIAGVGTDAATLAVQHPRAGVFGYDRITTFNDIKDGTSNTVMLMETAWANGPWAAGGQATLRALDPGGPPYLGKDGQFGGVHPGGVMVLFADGSVRFLHESTSPRALEALATIAGGEPIGRLDAD
jgi:prepilin-type processing-associated H-X9-DG protein